MNKSRDFTAYILVEENGKVPVTSGDVPTFWTRTAAVYGAKEKEEKLGRPFSIERVTITRPEKRPT